MAISLESNAPGGRTKTLDDGRIFLLETWHTALPTYLTIKIMEGLAAAKYKNPNVKSAIALAVALVKGDRQEQKAKTRAYLGPLAAVVLMGDRKVGAALRAKPPQAPKWAKGAEAEYTAANDTLAVQAGTLMSIITGNAFEGCNAKIEAELSVWHKAYKDAWDEWTQSDEGKARLAATARSGRENVGDESGGDFYDPRTGSAVPTNTARTVDSLRLAAAQAAAKTAAIKKMAADSAKLEKDFAAQLKAAEAAVGDE